MRLLVLGGTRFLGAARPRARYEELREDYANYGSLKALCEGAVAEVFPERHTNVRAGLLVGPHDPTGRFTYWPQRVARGGDALVPAAPDLATTMQCGWAGQGSNLRPWD